MVLERKYLKFFLGITLGRMECLITFAHILCVYSIHIQIGNTADLAR